MGRPALDRERKYEIKNIWDTHREIMRLLVTGAHSVDIARELGVTPQTVSNVMNSTICKRQMNLMRAARDVDALDVANRIQELAPIALQTLEELMCEGNESTKFKVSVDLLDRAGHTAVKTIRTENLHAHFSVDEIAEIKARAKEIGLVPMQQTIGVIDEE